MTPARRPPCATAAAALGLVLGTAVAVPVAVLVAVVAHAWAVDDAVLEQDVPPLVLPGLPAAVAAALLMGAARLWRGSGRRVLLAATGLLSLLALAVAVRAVGDSAARAAAALALCLVSATALGCAAHPTTGMWLTARRTQPAEVPPGG